MPSARVCLAFRDVEMIYLPFITQYSFKSDGFMHLTVMYIDVSHVARRDHRGVYIANLHGPTAEAVRTAESAPRLDRAAYYAPDPAASIDGENKIADVNIALRVLFGSDVEGWRHLHVGDVAAGVQDHVGSGRLFPLPVRADLLTEPVSGRCDYQTPDFGRVILAWTAVPRVGPETAGVIVFWHVLQVEEDARYREVLAVEIKRQLTWESYALSYDRVLPVLPIYQTVMKRHVDALLALGSGADLLDLGAGTGNVTAELLKAGRRVTAVDLSRAMLDRLRHKIPWNAASRLTVREQNAEYLRQWPDAAFDGITILLALYDMTRPQDALAEAIRLLRPGGTLVVTEPRRTFDLQALVQHVDRFLRDQGLYDACQADWERVIRANRDLDPGRRSTRLTIEEVEAEVRAAGLDVVRTEDSHLGHCATVWATRPGGR